MCSSYRSLAPVGVQVKRGRSQLLGSRVPSCGSSKQGPPLSSGVALKAGPAPGGRVAVVPSGPTGPPAKSVQPPGQGVWGAPAVPAVGPTLPPVAVEIAPPAPVTVTDPPVPVAPVGLGLTPAHASIMHGGRPNRAKRTRFNRLALTCWRNKQRAGSRAHVRHVRNDGTRSTQP